MFGLHIIDLVIIAIGLLAPILVGLWVSREVKNENEFYVGHKSLGRALQFFMNFGTMSDPQAASMVASSVFSNGAGGIWISGFQLLFATPVYWFSSVWFRRTRLITVSDLFIDRFNSKALATTYAAVTVLSAVFGMAFGNLVSYKVSAAMIVKPPAAYTTVERASIQRYDDYVRLKPLYSSNLLTSSDLSYYKTLDSESKHGDLKSYVSYLKPVPFYLAYSAVVCLYILLGGLKAAALTDAFQGVLILIFSVMLIPLGLSHVHGFAGLHSVVPNLRFALFGTEATSDFTWYSTIVVIVTSILSVTGGGGVSQAAAKNEDSIRFGMVGGAFAKRVITILWMLVGLLAIGLFPQGLSDPDSAWGSTARLLLPSGLLGLMIVAGLLGHMPAVGVTAVNVSALFTRNVYEQVIKDRSAAHYLIVARLAVVVFLGLGIALASIFTSFLSLMSVFITFGAFWGAMSILIYFWKPLTGSAVLVSMVLWLLLIGILPFCLGQSRAVQANQALTLQSRALKSVVHSLATPADVAAGLARSPGVTIKKTKISAPVALFWDSVARQNPQDPTSRLEGIGRFNIETFVLNCCGLPLTTFNSAEIVTARWLFDAMLPFVMMMTFSYLPLSRAQLFRIRPELEEQHIRSARFFAKMKTPIHGDPETDAREVQISYDCPTRFDCLNLFPRSNWVVGKWSRNDALGFGACWLAVAGIMLILQFVLRLK